MARAALRWLEAIKNGEARYWALFEHLLNGAAYCRMIFEGEEPVDFEYLAVNGAFERQAGLTNVVGKLVSEVIPGIRESAPDLLRTYGRVSRSGIPERFEIYLDPLASWFSVSVYCPQSFHFIAVFENITE